MLNLHVYLLHPIYLQMQLKIDVLLVVGELYHQVLSIINFLNFMNFY